MTNLIAFANDNLGKILPIVIAIVALFAIALVPVFVTRTKKRQKDDKETQEEAQTTTDVTEADEGQNSGERENTASYAVLSRNVMYAVGTNEMPAGKYRFTCADESQIKFNMRCNGLVKEYSNGDVLTLTEGDTLSPVSGSIVAQRAED